MSRSKPAKDREQRFFFTGLIHDLRSPLLAQKQALELLSRRPESLSRESAALLNSLISSNQTTLQLVNLVLETQQLDSGELILRRQPLCIQELIAQSQASFEVMAEAKGIRIINCVPKDTAIVNGDKAHLQRVFDNILSNAIIHLTTNKTIEIHAEQQEEMLLVSIRDNGDGIPVEMLKTLFDRYTGDDRLTRHPVSGLGLFICKTLIEMHGGNVDVHSEPGIGTCFSFTLPINN
jgi:signal transduction histidine kinase